MCNGFRIALIDSLSDSDDAHCSGCKTQSVWIHNYGGRIQIGSGICGLRSDVHSCCNSC